MAFLADADELRGAVRVEVVITATVCGVHNVMDFDRLHRTDADDAELAVRVPAQDAATLGLR